jgi:hypothetical protein
VSSFAWSIVVLALLLWMLGRLLIAWLTLD